jgi:hypothetical protein
MKRQKITHTLYRRLLALYPSEFRRQFGESMEQTFNDRYVEAQKTREGLFGFTAWIFAETAVGIFREHLFRISPGEIMQTILKSVGSSTFVSFLLLIPPTTMEIVNRRNFNESFPFALFFFMWLYLYAICLILLPIVQGGWAKNRDHLKTSGNASATTIGSVAMAGTALLPPLLLIVSLILSGWMPLEGPLNNTSPDQFQAFGAQVPSQFIALAVFLLPIVAGIVASRPIVRTLQAGGSLFAHPVNLLVVGVIVSIFAVGLTSLIIDQWPCFIGVPNCD